MTGLTPEGSPGVPVFQGLVQFKARDPCLTLDSWISKRLPGRGSGRMPI